MSSTPDKTPLGSGPSDSSSRDVAKEAEDLLRGVSVKDISLLIIIVAIAILFVVISVGIVAAIIADPTALKVGGEFDLSEWNASFLLIVGAGISMISQTLTAKIAAITRKQ